MKETEIVIKDQVEIVSEHKQKKELKHMTQTIMSPGHKCFELNIETGDIVEAQYIQTTVSFDKAKNGSLSSQRKLIIKDKCLYTTALNMKNALKRFKKMIVNGSTN